MKTTLTKSIRLFAVLALLLTAKTGFSQSCTPTITATNGANGSVSFYASVSGSGTYNWSFGNGSTATQSGTVAVQIASNYSANGIYTVTLFYINSANTCSSVVTQTVNITNANGCGLNASFTTVQGVNGNYTFNSNASTGVAGGATRTWIYGDNSPNGTGNISSHYYSPGIYTVRLAINNNTSPACIDTTYAVINVCSLTAGVVTATAANGAATFSVVNAMGTSSITVYSWNYGDGSPAYTGVGNGYSTASHIYGSNNMFMETLTMSNGNCTITISDSLNISTACLPNASFSLSPSGTPQIWNAYPGAPGSIANATWNWGDNSSSNTLFTSHTYSAAGAYSICLTVTATCGAVATNCYTYNIYRSSQDMSMVQINVIDVTTGIKNNTAANAGIIISPNPSSGSFSLKMAGLNNGSVNILIYDIAGKQVYKTEAETSNGSLAKDIQFDQAGNGVYFIKVSSGNNTYTQKMLINK